MSIFGGFFSNSVNLGLPAIRNEKEAYMLVLFAVISADGALYDSELDALLSICKSRNQFQDTDLEVMLDHIMEISLEANGAINLLRPALEKLSPEQKEAVFICSLDLVLSDGSTHKDETLLITELKQLLNLNPDFALMAEEIVRKKYL